MLMWWVGQAVWQEIDSVLTDSGNVMFFWASVMTENVYRCLDI